MLLNLFASYYVGEMSNFDMECLSLEDKQYIYAMLYP